MDEATWWMPHVTRAGYHMDISSSMLADGIIFINTAITQRVAGLVAQSLLELGRDRQQRRTPRIYLNTSRGDVISAMSIVDVIERYRRDDLAIDTLGIGAIGVATSLVIAAGSPGRRRISQHSQVSLFMGLDAFALPETIGDDVKMRQIETLRAQVIDLLVKYSKQPAAVLRNRLNREDFIDVEEAKKLNLIDDVL